MVKDSTYLLLSAAGTLSAAWVTDRVAGAVTAGLVTLSSPTLASELARVVMTPVWDPAGQPAALIAGGAVALGCMSHSTSRAETALKREVRGKEYGDARWATPAEYAQFAHSAEVRSVMVEPPHGVAATLRAARKEPGTTVKSILGMPVTVKSPRPAWCREIADDNILLTRTARLQASAIPNRLIERNKHVFVVGGSGSGKTYNFVGPNLMQLNGSYVVTDPKGQTAQSFAPFLAQNGYRVLVVDIKPDEIRYSNHYNPFAYLTNATSVLVLVNLLIENTTGNNAQSSSNSDFFVKAESQVFSFAFGYVHYFYRNQPEYQTFDTAMQLIKLAKEGAERGGPSVLDRLILGRSDKKGGPSKAPSYLEYLIGKYGSEEAARASEEWFVIDNYRGFKSTAGSPETEASILASCNVRMSKFSVDDVKSFFSTDELDLGSIGKRPTALFLVMPDTDSTFNFILAMLLYQLFDLNVQVADHSPGGHCDIPISCYLDEVANIGKIPDLDKKMATLRSRWINMCPIIQQFDQLNRWYKDTESSIVGNCDTLVYLGRSDLETNKKFSEMCGKRTIPVESRSVSKGAHGSVSVQTSWKEQDLLSASDMQSNPDAFPGDECLVFIKNARPIKDKKYTTFEHPRYAELMAAGTMNIADWGAHLELVRASSATGSLHATQAGLGTVATITDTVRHRGLVPGRTYTVRVEPMLVHGDSEPVPLALEDGSTSAEATFVPEAPAGSVDVPMVPAEPIPSGSYVKARETVLQDGEVWCTHTGSFGDGEVRFPAIIARTPTPVAGRPTLRPSSDWRHVVATFVPTGLAPSRLCTLAATLEERSDRGWVPVASRTVSFDSEGGSVPVEVTFDHVPGNADVRARAEVSVGATTAEVDGDSLKVSNWTALALLTPLIGYVVRVVFEVLEDDGTVARDPEAIRVEHRFLGGVGHGLAQVPTSASFPLAALRGRRVRATEELCAQFVPEPSLSRTSIGDGTDAIRVPTDWDGVAPVRVGDAILDAHGVTVAVPPADPTGRCGTRVTLSVHVRNIDGTDLGSIANESATADPGEAVKVTASIDAAAVRGTQLVPFVTVERAGVPIATRSDPDSPTSIVGIPDKGTTAAGQTPAA